MNTNTREEQTIFSEPLTQREMELLNTAHNCLHDEQISEVYAHRSGRLRDLLTRHDIPVNFTEIHPNTLHQEAGALEIGLKEILDAPEEYITAPEIELLNQAYTALEEFNELT